MKEVERGASHLKLLNDLCSPCKPSEVSRFCQEDVPERQAKLVRVPVVDPRVLRGFIEC